MHYSINDQIVIKSENAAKSFSQQNKHLIRLLNKFCDINSALDYGCGKGRYTLMLCKLAKQVDAIDSCIQVTRKQIIWGEYTTLLEWAKKTHNLKIHYVENFIFEKNRYDFILNSNVLSAIPNDSDRLSLLHNIKRVLTPGGTALITTQYRNSYFTTYESNPNAFKYNDGWIIKNMDKYSFYGLVNKQKLLDYFTSVGLSLVDVSCYDGSVFAIVTK